MVKAYGAAVRRVVVADPMPDKCVIVMYPHAGNWDFSVSLFSKWVVGLDWHFDSVIRQSNFAMKAPLMLGQSAISRKVDYRKNRALAQAQYRFLLKADDKPANGRRSPAALTKDRRPALTFASAKRPHGLWLRLPQLEFACAAHALKTTRPTLKAPRTAAQSRALTGTPATHRN